MINQVRDRLTMAFMGLFLVISPLAIGETLPPEQRIYSEPFCLKIFEEAIEKARSSSWQISDRDRHILTQCRLKYPATVNSNIPLPTASQCLDIVKILVRDGISKLKEIEMSEAQARSIQRCDEVLKYYDVTSSKMSPTLRPNDRIVVDRIIYQTRSPQRGDILVFNIANSQQQSTTPTPVPKRAIGLPGETVKIVNGRISINGKPIREDYSTAPVPDWNESIVVPPNSYFVLGDNRSIIRDPIDREFVPREAIVGKVIWHFGGSYYSLIPSRSKTID